VLDRTAAAGDDDHINIVPIIEITHAPDDLLYRTGPLNTCGIDEHVKGRIAPFENSKYVSDGRPGRRRHNSDFSREKRQWLLSFLLEEAFAAKLFLQLIESQLQRAQPDRLHVLNHHLIITARLVNREPPAHDHFQAVFGAKFQIAVVVPEASRLEL